MIKQLSSIYHSRSIIFALVSKNLKGRYRNSLLGILWQFLTPAVSVLLFYILFTSLRQNSMENYWIYLCAGMFPFSFLNGMIVGGGSCIISNASIVKKMNIPREILVISFALSSFITFVISYTIVIIVIALSGNLNSFVCILCILPLIAATLLFGIGIVLILSAVCVYIRDLMYTITAFARVLFWMTPVFYTVDSLTGILSKVIWCNPLTIYITSYQNCLYYSTLPTVENMFICCSLAIITVVIGLGIFSKLKHGFAERV